MRLILVLFVLCLTLSFSNVKAGYLFVANQTLNTVSVIDTKKLEKIKDIKVGKYPSGLCVAGETLFVANKKSDTVSVIDTTTLTKTKDIQVGEKPVGLCVDGETLFVANSKSNTVSVIDIKSSATRAYLYVKKKPTALCVAGNMLYILNSGSIYVSATCISRFRTGDMSHKGFTRNHFLQTEDTATYYIEGSSSALCVAGKTLFIADNKSNTVSAFHESVSIVTERIEVGKEPHALCVDGDFLYVGNSQSKHLSVINTKKLEKVMDIQVGFWLKAFCVAENKFFFSHWGTGAVDVVDMEYKKLKTINFGGITTCMLYHKNEAPT